MNGLAEDATKKNADMGDMAHELKKEATKQGKCFTKSSKVFKQVADTFVQVEMGTLAKGDKVLTYDKKSGNYAVEEIIYLIDHGKEKGSQHQLTTLIRCSVKAQDGRLLNYAVSEGHKVSVKRSAGSEFQEVLAENMHRGDTMMIYNHQTEDFTEGTVENVEVDKIRRSELMLVWTESMTIVVDNIVSSCHTEDWMPWAQYFVSSALSSEFLQYLGLSNYIEAQTKTENTPVRKFLQICGYNC